MDTPILCVAFAYILQIQWSFGFHSNFVVIFIKQVCAYDSASAYVSACVRTCAFDCMRVLFSMLLSK